MVGKSGEGKKIKRDRKKKLVVLFVGWKVLN
jgi:hypothetical protein